MGGVGGSGWRLEGLKRGLMGPLEVVASMGEVYPFGGDGVEGSKKIQGVILAQPQGWGEKLGFPSPGASL